MSNELTLDDVLGKDFKIEQFGYIFSNTLLNTVEQRFIQDDDSRIIDLKIVPQGNFAGYFKVSIRKQIIDIFDITTHMVYSINGYQIKDKYISTINVDFSNDTKERLDDSVKKITKLTDQLISLIKTVQKDFECETFYILMKEFEIPEIDLDVDNSYIEEFHNDEDIFTLGPIDGEVQPLMKTAMNNLIDIYLKKNTSEKSSSMDMHNEITINCELSSLNIKSSVKLLFNITQVSFTDTLHLVTEVVTMNREEQEIPDPLCSILLSPTCKLCNTFSTSVIDAKEFIYNALHGNECCKSVLSKYSENVSNEVANCIYKLTSNHTITVSVRSEVIKNV